MANVLIYAPFANWCPHFETDLELAALALERGDNVTFFTCDGSLPTCEPNYEHSFLRCAMCKSRAAKGLEWLKSKQKKLTVSTYNLNARELSTIKGIVNQPFNSIAEIKDLTYEGSDIGMAAISSAISQLREPGLSLDSDLYLIRSHLETALRVHHSLQIILQEAAFDEVILFNGRFSALRPVLRAARLMKINVSVHERGPYINQYRISPNHYPHDPNACRERLRSVMNVDKAIIQDVGNRWFEDRFNNIQQGLKTFSQEHDKSLSVQIKHDAINVAIFVSSEDEHEAIPEWKNQHYMNQCDGIRRILQDASQLNCHFLLRAHPNLVGIDNSQTRELAAIANEFNNLTYIAPESKISTYELIKQSDLVIVFGSTVGIEAAYLNKPVFVMGKAVYDVLECCIKPKSHEVLIDMLDDYIATKKLPEIKNDAAVYGYLFSIPGIEFIYFRQTGFYEACLLDNGHCKKLGSSLKYLFFLFLFNNLKRTARLLRAFIPNELLKQYRKIQHPFKRTQ
ncbi:hypothetical protein ACFL0R_04975 [Pseudomonadota bacterium]